VFFLLRNPPQGSTQVYLDIIVVESLTDSLAEFLNNGSGDFSSYSQFDVSDRIVDRRFNPAAIHPQDDAFGRSDYDLVYHIEAGRAVLWFTDLLEYTAYTDGGQMIHCLMAGKLLMDMIHGLLQLLAEDPMVRRILTATGLLLSMQTELWLLRIKRFMMQLVSILKLDSFICHRLT
jgi:hypothetical protein